MIELQENELVFSFPEVHEYAHMRINFQRTLRIPDDNRSYHLPPGLGSFPLSRIDDHPGRVPAEWNKRGGVFLPMYQAEALWIAFGGDYPMAVKVAAGKINALTGEAWANDLQAEPQDYAVVPEQPWIDGFCIEEGLIRQFVAMPLGAGYSAEEQLTGEAQHGGLQIAVYPMKRSRYEEMKAEGPVMYEDVAYSQPAMAPLYAKSEDLEMGLAPGGLMRQEIYDDPWGFDAWDLSVRSRCFVHIMNSKQYLQVTGSAPPHKPVTALDYSKAGLPWFEYYDADLKALEGASNLAGLDSVAAKSIKIGDGVLPNNEAVSPKVVALSGRRVREGEF